MFINNRSARWLFVLAFSVVTLLISLTLIDTAAAQDHGPQAALGTAFTYQGRLIDSGVPATGTYDLQFALYDAGSAGTQVGLLVTQEDIPVSDGYFTTLLDFGNVFNGTALFMQIGVRPGSSTGSYTPLSPRVSLTAVPYAGYALNNWSLNGNANTNGTGFLGTTDNTTLTIGVNGQAGLRIYPNAQSPNIAGGYSGNTISPAIYGATIAGGGSSSSPNRASANYATIGGGSNNLATMLYAFVGGGYSNTVATGADYGAIAGGRQNLVASFEATVGGGRLNSARGGNSTIGGGFANTASGGTSFIGGGQGNVVTPTAANGVVAGGQSNLVEGESATIGGGVFNKALGLGATVSGGGSNIATSSYAAIGGGSSNQTNGLGATIGGGTYNTTGLYNYATVGGGTANTANGGVATVGGGSSNQANGDWSFVGGGLLNLANGANASIGGGNVNFASGDYTSIMGGTNNTASGYIATVAGGLSNVAQGSGSFAAGTRAKALHNGTFVWGDSSPFNDVASTAANQFVARASGGVTFFTSFDLSTGVTAAPGSGSWSSTSDRNVKANFSLVDARDVLQRLAQIPISTWNYKAQDTAIRHIGPMAQDFAAAFGVGEDDKHISTIDADGVSLAAIQGLYQIAQEKDQQIAQLQARLDALESHTTASAAIGAAAPSSLIWFVAGAVIGLGAFRLGSRRKKGDVR